LLAPKPPLSPLSPLPSPPLLLLLLCCCCYDLAIAQRVASS
jgi:hypothetical protein